MEIQNFKHPEYVTMIASWVKFRDVMDGGSDFVKKYVKRFSKREDPQDYAERIEVSYAAAHAKAAIIDIRNAIYQRMVDITRTGGTPSYQKAIVSNVDHRGNTMNSFIGRLVLPDLLAMGKVGVYVDRPPIPDNATKADTQNRAPFIYHYGAEDIRSWSEDDDANPTAYLLRDHIDEVDEEFGLVIGKTVRYRLLLKLAEGIGFALYDKDSEIIPGSVKILNLPEIPFHVFDIRQSLLTDVADHQIALTNIASADIHYCVKANFPFYVEQFNAVASLPYMRQAVSDPSIENLTDTEQAQGTAKQSGVAKPHEINTGAAGGRRYGKGLEQPAFIHPSPEPLLASMKKGQEIREEIRQLVNLAVTNVDPRRASAESKQEDSKSLEAGLSFIGEELQFGERRISTFWSNYEKSSQIADVTYPETYSLKSEEDRRREGNQLQELMESVPSQTYQREIAHRIVTVTLGHRLPSAELNKIHNEINEAAVVVIDNEALHKDLEAGLVGNNLASKIRGYPDGEVERAKADHAERAARILEAQTAARGVDDLGNDDPSKEKEGKPKRGKQVDKK